MSTKSLNVKLIGKGQLHEPIIRLENISINIWSIDGGVTWENKNVDLDIQGALNIFMSCKAISGTTWEFVITEKGSSKKYYDEEGVTGEPLASQDGERIANYSERLASVNI